MFKEMDTLAADFFAAADEFVEKMSNCCSAKVSNNRCYECKEHCEEVSCELQ